MSSIRDAVFNFKQRMADYKTGPSAAGWKKLCEGFVELDPGDNFGPCECGGVLVWTKGTRGWAAICSLCRRQEYSFIVKN
jgi:hypothetical protein